MILFIGIAKLYLATELVGDKLSRVHAIDLRMHRDTTNVRIEIESDRSQSLLGQDLIDHLGVAILIVIVCVQAIVAVERKFGARSHHELAVLVVQPLGLELRTSRVSLLAKSIIGDLHNPI